MIEMGETDLMRMHCYAGNQPRHPCLNRILVGIFVHPIFDVNYPVACRRDFVVLFISREFFTASHTQA